MKLDLDHGDIKSGFAVGKAAAIADWAFRKERREGNRLVALVRSLKWQHDHPERRRAHARRYAAKPDVKARHLREQKRRRLERHRAEGKVFTCQLDYCGAQFCRVPGIRGLGLHPRFCSQSHYVIWRYRQKADPAKRRACRGCGELGHNIRGCKARKERT